MNGGRFPSKKKKKKNMPLLHCWKSELGEVVHVWKTCIVSVQWSSKLLKALEMPSSEGFGEEVHGGKDMPLTSKKIYVRRHANANWRKEGNVWKQQDTKKVPSFYRGIQGLENNYTLVLIADVVWGYLGIRWINKYSRSVILFFFFYK